MRYSFFFVFLSSLFMISVGAEEAKAPPSADALLARVRHATTMTKDQMMKGVIRKNKTKVPFGIQLAKGNICFNFSPDGTQWQTFDLKFKEAGQELYTVENGKAIRFSPSRYGESLAGTDVTFEDLSLRFLYWPQGTILPHDHTAFIKGRKCYIVDVPNPVLGSGSYAWIRAWIDVEMGALWQIDAFDAQGKHLKRFSITSVQKTDESWFFKQMRIEVRDKDNPKKTIAVNYIELD